MSTPTLTYAPADGARSLADAYSTCRGIARREAKNFYYAFLALPAAKRDAICAVYAFMRKADDLADDESQPLDTRLAQMQVWNAQWHEALAQGHSSDPVFVALDDARRRFCIPLSLLEQLVEGTTMDLVPAGSPSTKRALETYETFANLYRYCYLVASVVGLVCIRIFGYRDPRAEQLAEELGVAFQLTNIVRDVREDAERGRIYLPLEDLRTHQLTPETIAREASGNAAVLSEQMRSLLAFESARAEQFYLSGKSLLPLIDAESRPALWVLITIYHRLLRRIVSARYDVFTSRMRVPTYEKVAILGIGLCRLLGARSAASLRARAR